MNGKMNEDGAQELFVNGKITVSSNVASKNLFNDKKIILTNSSINYTDDSFTISSNGYWGYGEYTTYLEKGTYTLSGEISGNPNVNFVEIYKDDIWIIGAELNSGKYTFTLDSQTKIIMRFYATTGVISQGTTTFSKVQLEKGTTTTDYVPYLNLEEAMNMFNGFTQINSLVTNLGVSFYAQQIKYKKIGNMVFFYIIVNTKAVSTNTDDFYVEIPFTFASDWYIPMIKANNSSDTETYYLKPEPGTNKIYLTKDHNRGKLKCNALHSGYIIDCQFFAFVE